MEDVKATRVHRHREASGTSSWSTYFMQASKGTRLPQFILIENSPGRVIRTHYHDVDQFQIVVAGSGRFGKHKVAPFSVHFARAYTPYGPITAGSEGLAWLTIRANRDSDRAQYLPEKRENLEKVPDRFPWQATAEACFESCGEKGGLQPVTEFKDENGLGVYYTRLAPFGKAMTPSPKESGGQFIVALRGNVILQGREREAPAMCFVGPEEESLAVAAGAQGLDLMVLHFPKVGQLRSAAAPASATGSRVWRCSLCGLEYREDAGMPSEGIAAGSRWEDVPSTWTCPDCQAGKHDFVRVEG